MARERPCSVEALWELRDLWKQISDFYDCRKEISTFMETTFAKRLAGIIHDLALLTKTEIGNCLFSRRPGGGFTKGNLMKFQLELDPESIAEEPVVRDLAKIFARTLSGVFSVGNATAVRKQKDREEGKALIRIWGETDVSGWKLPTPLKPLSVSGVKSPEIIQQYLGKVDMTIEEVEEGQE